MASPNARGRPINIGMPNDEIARSFSGRQSPVARSPAESLVPEATLRPEQLAELRAAYQQYGTTPPVAQIPLRPPSSMAASGAATPSACGRSLVAEPLPGRAAGSSSISIRSGVPVSRPNESNLSIDNLSDAQKARIVRKHLMNREEQEAARRAEGDAAGESGLYFDDELPGGQTRSHSGSGDGDEDGDAYPMPFHLQGGDIHHDLYKWHQKQQMQSGTPSRPGYASMSQTLPDLRSVTRVRSNSMLGTSRRGSDAGSGFATPAEDGEMGYRDIMQPGGFRRAYLLRKRAASGRPATAEDGRRITRSFVQFLTLYGHFGGEDLEEIDEEEERNLAALRALEDLEEADEEDEGEGSGGGEPPTERTPLARKKSARTKIDKHASGKATVTQAVLMLLKSFVGTGVLFLAKAFYNGGLLFSVVMLVFLSLISLWSFLLLVETWIAVPGGFGEIGGVLYGPGMRRAILCSLVLAQLGFVAAYTVFIAQNLQAFVMAVSDCKTFLPIYIFIAVQLVVYLPLAMVRNIQKLSGTALIADAFILVGLVYLFGNEIQVIAEMGPAPMDLFNAKSFPLLIGTAVFTFEGIGLVIPITESMKEPEKSPKALTGVMFGITILFAGAGVLGYAAYGSDVQTVVIVNLPQEDRFVNAVQFLYSMAIMLSTPLQLFPAVRIMENGLFSTSGKYSNKVKWQKNLFRVATVLFTATVAWLGAADLDKFVSLIGSAACVPLSFCYPSLLHYRACARTPRQKAADIALFLFGLIAAVYTSVHTFSLIFSGEDSGVPQFGKCKPPTP